MLFYEPIKVRCLSELFNRRNTEYREIFFRTYTSVNGLQLQEVGDFTTNVDTENQTLFNHKYFIEARQSPYCQTDVTSSAFLSVEGLIVQRHFVGWLCKLFCELGSLCSFMGFVDVLA